MVVVVISRHRLQLVPIVSGRRVMMVTLSGRHQVECGGCCCCLRVVVVMVVVVEESTRSCSGCCCCGRRVVQVVVVVHLNQLINFTIEEKNKE